MKRLDKGSSRLVFVHTHLEGSQLERRGQVELRMWVRHDGCVEMMVRAIHASDGSRPGSRASSVFFAPRLRDVEEYVEVCTSPSGR
jgi:hypothetical protein